MNDQIQVNSLSEYLTVIKAEASSFTLFRGQNSNKALVPKIGRINLNDDLLRAEKSMIAELKLRAQPYVDLSNSTEWDILAIAQHHGMATRLLDWTTNPLAALWFAVEKQPEVKSGKPCDGVVWICKPEQDDFVTQEDLENLSPFSLKRTKVFRPRHISERITAQSGWFTVHKYFKQKFVALNNNNRYKPKLLRLSIPHQSFYILRNELEMCNVNASTIYPGLDGICRYVEWLNYYMDDEVGKEKTQSIV